MRPIVANNETKIEKRKGLKISIDTINVIEPNRLLV